MNEYRVKSISISGRRNKIFYSGQIVNESDFIPNRANTLVGSGHLEKIYNPSAIGVLIPTRNRQVFLEKALFLLQKQTVQPNIIEIIDDEPLTNDIDITYRYRIGVERLKNKGAEVIIFWEDDDFYASNYIEIMLKEWEKAGKPDIFGIGNSTYYHILCNKYMTIGHSRRASMYSTMIKADAKIIWGRDNDPYADVVLWKQLKGKTFIPSGPINLGIKHGIGLVGGGGHTEDFAHYNQSDIDKNFLKLITGEDFKLYDMSKYKYSKTKHSEKPFLSIITRVYKRPVGLSKNKQSILDQADKDIEQIFITDEVGYGLFEANKSFSNLAVVSLIDGEYVYLLDDDDFLVNKNMVKELKEIAVRENPDVIFFRMTIKNNMNNNHYPTEHCWKNKPMIAHIGGSCFVVKKEIYQKFIHNFAHARCGDFHFINAVFESGAKCYWHDVLMAETGKVSRGKAE